MNVDVLLHDMLTNGFERTADQIIRLTHGEKLARSELEDLCVFAKGLRAAAQAVHPAMRGAMAPEGFEQMGADLPSLEEYVRKTGQANVATGVTGVETNDDDEEE